MDEGPDRDALTEALGREHYVPVYLDPKTARLRKPRSTGAVCAHSACTASARSRPLVQPFAHCACASGSMFSPSKVVACCMVRFMTKRRLVPVCLVKEAISNCWLHIVVDLSSHRPCLLLQVDLHYNGFCNSVLWQLFHYVPLNIDSKLSETRTLQFQWAAHQVRVPCAILPFLTRICQLLCSATSQTHKRSHLFR